MEFNIGANLILSKDLTIEADSLSDAIEQAQQQMGGKIPFSELTFRDVKFELLSHAIGDRGLEGMESPKNNG